MCKKNSKRLKTEHKTPVLVGSLFTRKGTDVQDRPFITNGRRYFSTGNATP